MSAESDFVALLKATPAVTALIGSGAAARLAADRIEQAAALPFVVFTRVGTEEFAGLDGTVFDTKVTLEVQCWGETRKGADALADAVAAALRAANQAVVGRTGGYDGELDLEAAVLTVEWW
jgi:hypothetical protein